MLTNRQFAYARDLDGTRVIISVNNDDAPAGMHLAAGNCATYVGAMSGKKVSVQDGHINITQPANSGEIWVPDGTDLDVKPVKVEAATIKKVENKTAATTETATTETISPEKSADKSTVKNEVTENAATDPAEKIQPATPGKSETENDSDTPVDPETITVDWSKSPESMTVPELQAAVLAKLAGNGPVDAQMKKTVTDNVWHDSLVNWLKSFR